MPKEVVQEGQSISPLRDEEAPYEVHDHPSTYEVLERITEEKYFRVPPLPQIEERQHPKGQ